MTGLPVNSGGFVKVRPNLIKSMIDFCVISFIYRSIYTNNCSISLAQRYN
jgi:hypothetical protein